ncbi:MAG TPA: tetratricopeptide repeat protein [Candidatus Angelobacter sp.]|nr:tetratricopeptide repeat protein [Candidatus Angelobacter sp.]
MMTPERWSRIKEIFSSVLDRSAEERQHAILEACQGDTELQAELQQLLAQHDEMGQFLEGDSPVSAAGLLNPNDILAGRYEIIALLGSGGMGEVYEVEDKELGGRIALKVVHPQMSFDQTVLERFRREVLLARQVTHPNVCRVFDIGYHKQQGREIIFLTMELVRGETLAARLKRDGRLESREALAIATQLCQALGAAHQAGVLHRDFKCGNVILIGSGETVRAVVTDFGIARWTRSTQDSAGMVTTQGAIFGTPAYMSPEQLQGKELTIASDIYSLGLVLYEMVTGARPFQGESSWTEALKRLTDDPVAPVKVSAKLGRNWNAVILKCLERDPSKRISPVGEVLALLTESRKRPWMVRKPLRLAVVAATLLIATVAMAVTLRVWIWPSLPASKHVAVLPFSFAGNDSASNAFAYGLSESLTGHLARLEPSNSSLWVVPWSQVRNVKPADSGNAATALGVNLLLTGQVEKHGSGLRMRAVLKDAGTLKELRSQIIDVAAPEAVTLEDTLLARVAGMLQLQLPEGALHHLPGEQTTVPGAYEFYEQGRGYLRHGDMDNVDRAINLLRKAIELDPRFAIAYADLGSAYVLKFRVTKEVKWLTQATQMSSQALVLNDGLAAAHLAQAMTLQDTGDMDGAIVQFQRALALDPTDDEILRQLALAYDADGKVLEAERLIKDTIRRNPASWVSYNLLGYFYYRHAQYDQAEPQFRTATELAPDYLQALNNLGGVYLAEGKYKEAETILTRSVALKPSVDAYSNQGTAYFHLAKFPEAAAAYLQATKINPGNYLLWSNLASAYSGAGDSSKAARAYERAIQELKPVLALRPNDGLLLETMAFYYAQLQQQTMARTLLNQALRHPANSPEFLFNAARLYAITGQREQALSALRAAVRAGYSLSEIQSDEAFTQLRADHRFAGIPGAASGKQGP